MKTLTALLVSLFVCLPGYSQRIPLIIRCDDIGMCHTVNIAFEKVLQTGIPVSASVMFACPWYQEAVDMLKLHPEVSVGIHLTLNAEWKNYRWGPVSGSRTVPTLVDSCGFFFPSRSRLFAHNPSIHEIEVELRAQIDRAIGSGLKIDYVDYHMGAAVQTPELRSLVERLASEYKLGISRWFGETDMRGAYSVSPANKLDTLVNQLRGTFTAGPSLLVFHVGLETEEMNALIDLNPFGPPMMSKHRNAELEALTSATFRSVLRERQFALLTYRQLIEQMGLSSMKRPSDGTN
jgi:chitin disaccharide deacetylase